MTTDSRQQKEKQSKAKGCLWVIAGVGFEEGGSSERTAL